MAARFDWRPGSEGAPRRREVMVDVAPVAQLDRALDYGSKGWGFDSSRAHDGTKPASPGEGRDGAADRAAETVGYRSGQTGQTVNLLAYAFVGSNPTPTTAAMAGTSGRPRVWMETGRARSSAG